VKETFYSFGEIFQIANNKQISMTTIQKSKSISHWSLKFDVSLESVARNSTFLNTSTVLINALQEAGNGRNPPSNGWLDEA
jgi:hypothetical protein